MISSRLEVSLMSCPFCGSARVELGFENVRYMDACVICKDCGAQGPWASGGSLNVDYSENERAVGTNAATGWNTRPEPSADGPVYWAVKGPDGIHLKTVDTSQEGAYESLQPYVDGGREWLESHGYRAKKVRLVEVEPQEVDDAS